MSRIIRLAVALFPPAFRREFGSSMRAMAGEEIDRARSRGRLAAWRCTLYTVMNLAGAACAEWVRPTWNVDPSDLSNKTKGHRMRTFEHWLRDLRFAARSLARTPGFAAVTAVTLALAIGANAAIFAVADAVLLRPLPFANADRLMFVAATAPGSEIPGEFGLFDESFPQVRERSHLVEDFALYSAGTGTLRIGDRVERPRLADVTYNLFATLGARPVLGRLPGPDDHGRVALLSYQIWRDWLGRDPNVIGKTFIVDGEPRAIIGVMGPEFGFPSDNIAAWTPFDVRPSADRLGQPGGGAIARVHPGASPDDVARELTGLLRQLPDRYGNNAAYARLLPRLQVVARPLRTEMLGSVTRPLAVLFAAALIVLVIACANVTNLFGVRAENRRHEVAIRQAIGAQRSQIIRSQMTEVIVVAFAAAVLAVVCARVALPVFVALAPVNVPRLAAAAIGFTTIAFTFVLALGSGLVCGVVPALRSSSVRALDMRASTRSVTGRRRWERDALLAGQTALALVLLVGAGLLLRSYARLSHVSPGYSTKDLFTFQFAPKQPRLTDGPSWAQFHLDFMDRLRALPGVQSVGIVDNMPLDEGTESARFMVDGAPEDGAVRLAFTIAGPDYYETMGIKVLAGRGFTRDDALGMRGNVIISRSAAKLLWPNADPIGRRLTSDRAPTWETVVGVVDDVIQENWRRPAQPLVYYPLTGHDPREWMVTSPGYVIRTTRAESIGADVQALVRQVAPEAPVYRAYTMQFLAERQMRDLSFTMLTLGLVSGLAIVLAAVGLYGALSYIVAQRTREIGVRLALGAQPRTVRRMVVRQGAQIVGAGVLAGTIVALGAAPALGRLLFGVAPIDLLTFVAAVAWMIVVGLFASYLPARRASNVDPIVSLRSE
ncbi:MAG TPA: ABC transporter permease [Vicinamibacterales bacterium]|nr:ABC transporter permease [Vicinamibacterales bacterium]